MTSSHQERHRRHRRSHLQGRRPRRDGMITRSARTFPATDARCDRLLRHAGRHRSAYASRNAVHGHLFGRRFRKRHAGGADRRHDDGGRFLPAQSPNQSLLEALQMWDNKTVEGLLPTTPSTWRSPGGASRCGNEMAEVVDRGITTFKHFMAYKGALMVDDDEMFSSFQRCADLGALPLVHAENGDVVAQLPQKLLAEGNNGPGGACLFAAAGSRGRGHQPRDHDRRHGGRAGLYRPHLLRAGA